MDSSHAVDICYRGLNKPGVPSPHLRYQEPGVEVQLDYVTAAADARASVATQYTFDLKDREAASTMRVVDIGDVGYAFQGPDHADSPNTAKLVVVTGNVIINVEVIDPNQASRWDTATRDQALTAATTFLGDNLPFIERS